MVKVLLTGGRGQVGQAVLAQMPAAIRVDAPPRAELDLTRPASMAAWLDRRPDIVVNAAAFAAVEEAEDRPEAAFAVNRDGAAELARQSAARGIALIQLSTDYVFDGRKAGAYVETDAANPLNVYGRSKLAGEEAIRACLDRHVILRCSWIFGPHGANFVRSILARAARGERLRVVDDQRGRPTASVSVARAILAVVQAVANGSESWGTYHYGGREPVTWFEFAEAALGAARPWLGEVPPMTAIPSADFPTRAQRPANSVLDCTRFEARFGCAPESWQRPLKETVAAIGASLAAGCQPRA